MKDLFTSIENGGEWNKEVGDNPQGVLEFEKAKIKNCFEDLSNMKNFMDDDYSETKS